MSFMGAATAPGVKLTKIGESVTGVIAGKWIERQQTDYVSNLPKFFPDGSPMIQFVVPLYVADEFGPDDNGLRTLYIKGGMTKPARAAVAATGATEPAEGGTFVVTYTGNDAPKNPGMPGQKCYQVRYTKPASDSGQNYEEPPGY
jgi:hypothetical protein